MINLVVTPLTSEVEEQCTSILLSEANNVDLIIKYPELYEVKYLFSSLENNILYYKNLEKDIIILTNSPIVIDCVETIVQLHKLSLEISTNLDGCIINNNEINKLYQQFADVMDNCKEIRSKLQNN